MNENELEKTEKPEIAEGNDIADLVIDEMSEPSEHAIEQEKEKPENGKPPFQSTAVDKNGNSFDPEIHSVDAEGNPKLNKSGTLKIKAGAKKGSKKSSVGGVNIDKPQNIGSREAGTVAANILITLGCTIGGDEWQPKINLEYGFDEKANLEMAFGQYFEATGRTDFPPGVALAIAVGGYIAPRFTQPKTKSRLRKASEWVFLKWRGLKNRKVKTPEADDKGGQEK